MKIFDCFQFYDEHMMLDLRLNILDQYVDKFIIVENLYLHSGKKKKKNFDIDKYQKFRDKIEYILVDKLPDNLYDISKVSVEDKNNRIIDNTLKIEHNQRNKILLGLNNANENDLILISDVDEIPKLENIKNKIKNKIVIFKQKIFYYKFNLMYGNKSWIGTKAILKKNLLTPQWLRDVKDKKYPFWRIDTFFSKMKYSDIQHIDDGGWHFTNFKTPKELEMKLDNFGHHAEFKESGLKIKDIEKMMKENRAIYDYDSDMRESKWAGKKTLNKVKLDNLPNYINLNKKKYLDWFI